MPSDSPTTKLSFTILSNVHPFSMPLSSSECEYGMALTRWRSAFGSFSFWHTCSEESSKKSEQFEYMDPGEFLKDECSRIVVLQKLEDPLNHIFPNENSNDAQPSIESVRSALLQTGQANYEEIWESLTFEEQLALYHLARDRFIHVGHPGLDPLFRKGLIRFDPDLRIINTSFREFVRQAGDRDKLAHQESTHGKSLWDSLKLPVGLGFTIVVGTLILTQEELRTALPAVFAALPFLLQGLSDFTKTKKLTS